MSSRGALPNSGSSPGWPRIASPRGISFEAHDKKKEARVVVLVSCKPGLHPDLAGVDRMFNAELIQKLDARLKENEEPVLVMKMPWLDKYKSDNPNWHAIHPYDIGKEANADYLIDVEIDEMDIYKPGSRGQWLLGHSTVSVSAYDISKPIKDPAMRKELTFDYPRSGEIEAESRAHISNFRLKFVQRMASDTSVLFSSSEADHKRRFD